jgi:sulfur-carrier protein
MPTVKIPPVLRAETGGQAEVEAGGSSVGEVLRSLVETHSGTQRQLFSGDGELNRYVNVYLNDEDVRVLDGLETPVSDSDTVVILPAMAGGGSAASSARPTGQVVAGAVARRFALTPLGRRIFLCAESRFGAVDAFIAIYATNPSRPRLGAWRSAARRPTQPQLLPGDAVG